jgi:coproporphyrinogen III oxidase-like Fe-S oxidoreductase
MQVSRSYITAVTFEAITDYAVEKASLNIASLQEEQLQLMNLGCNTKHLILVVE